MKHADRAGSAGSAAAWLPAVDELRAYADRLSTVGVERGIVGPNEVGRIWDRHITNCAAVALDDRVGIESGASVIDVGSGAGLPGLVWSLVRPDLTVTLVEPMLRRSQFLTETVELLQVGGRVAVVRARAEDLRGEVAADIVTARAVAPMIRLVGLALPLVRPGGRLVALKGEAVDAEIGSARAALAEAGATLTEVVVAGEGRVDEPTRVVLVLSPPHG